MIHVCYNLNSKIFDGLLLSAMSIAKHSSEPVQFHILSADLSHLKPEWTSVTAQQAELLNAAIRTYDERHDAELIDCAGEYAKYLADGRNRMSIYTPYNLFRLFLDVIELKGNPDKIIYIDTDTMCRRDIKELWDVDINDYEFAAALDFMGKKWINKNYCNAGVLYINLKKVKETGLWTKARQRVHDKTMAMPDQSALHDLATFKLVLPDKFNEQRTIKEDTVIKHFCKGIKFYLFIPRVYNYKQWQRDKVHKKLKIHDFDDIYGDFDAIMAKHGR